MPVSANAMMTLTLNTRQPLWQIDSGVPVKSINRGDRCTFVEEVLDYILMAFARGKVKRCPPVVIGVVQQWSTRCAPLEATGEMASCSSGKSFISEKNLA
eukprot:2241067-Rhodomonas_salina.1